MAKFDYGGGCPCGLYRDCIPQCENNRGETIKFDNSTNRTVKGPSKMDEEHDFGFSFATEEELTVVRENTEKVQKLREMIMPLLANLKKNPDKDVIKWEGAARIKSIDSFINKMNKLIDE